MKKKIIIISSIVLGIVLLCLISLFLLTKATPIEDGSLEWVKNTKISHRGLHNNDDIPENSLKAYKKSIDENVAIELDVQLTKDNKVVVFHDYNLERMTGSNKNVNELEYIDILDLKLLNTNEYIPTLNEVLELIDGKVPLLIEIKNEDKVGILESEVYNIIKDYKGDIAVQAFNPFVLSWFKKNAPEIPRGQLSGSFDDSDLPKYKKFLLKNLLLNFESKPAFIAYEVDYLPKAVVKFQRNRNVPILGWTVKSTTDLEKVKENCDNIIYEE